MVVTAELKLMIETPCTTKHERHTDLQGRGLKASPFENYIGIQYRVVDSLLSW